MAINFQAEDEVKDFIKNLGIEYRFGCYSEKKGEVCHLLGDYFEAIDKDYEKASKVYKNTCDDYKYPKSCSKFATYALLGRGLRHSDPNTAYNYFKKGCKLNDPASCLHQGLLLISKTPEMNQVKQNVPKGIVKLVKACNGQNANACYYLSGLYISGIKKSKDTDKMNGDEFDLAKDMKLAFKYANQACELGNIYSCANLSQMYAKGDGVEKNEEMAAKYKKKALDLQNDIKEGKTLTFQEGLT